MHVRDARGNVPVVPEVKLSIEGVTFLLVFFLLELQEDFTLLEAYGPKLVLKVVEELRENRSHDQKYSAMGLLTSNTPLAFLIILTSVM